MANDLVTVLVGPSEDAVEIQGALIMRQALLDTVDIAERELIIVGYMIDDEKIVDRICSKSASVSIIVHVDEKQTSDWPRAKAAVSKMRRSGAIVKLHNPGSRESLHAKVMVADSKEAIVGSANLTSRGADRNFEVGVKIRGPSARILRDAMIANLGGGQGDAE